MDLARLTCPVRKATVSALPEERVRVQLLYDLIEKLEFPASSISVEKELSQIPHLRSLVGTLPTRRIDILCFAKDIHPTEEFYPLLVIECKAVKLTSKMVRQVVGYNHYLKAPYIALVNQEEIRFGWYDVSKGMYMFASHLPTYHQLLQYAQKKLPQNP
ncbi:MAG: type I restriction enzyme HsdR N-terminal domain-containing protein [Parachlamydiaceae bacterium]|nr:type I restriction enzyme HsdR N-terminal domain-containing protein [Parachlamydiaceae bacterium]